MRTLNTLIVDDNAFVRKAIMLNLKLGKFSYSLEETENGLEAVNLAKKNKYDLILMDISMPIMNGLDASAKILEFNPNQIIIAVSMHSSKDEIELLKEMGVKGYVLKEDLAKEIEFIIERALKGEAVFDLNYY